MDSYILASIWVHVWERSSSLKRCRVPAVSLDHSSRDNRRAAAAVAGVKRDSEVRRLALQFVKVCRPTALPSPLWQGPAPGRRHTSALRPTAADRPCIKHRSPRRPRAAADQPNLFTLTKISIYNRCRPARGWQPARTRVNCRGPITSRVCAGNWRLFMLAGPGGGVAWRPREHGGRRGAGLVHGRSPAELITWRGRHTAGAVIPTASASTSLERRFVLCQQHRRRRRRRLHARSTDFVYLMPSSVFQRLAPLVMIRGPRGIVDAL